MNMVENVSYVIRHVDLVRVPIRTALHVRLDFPYMVINAYRIVPSDIIQLLT